MEVTLDKFGRIVIPKPVRDALGLEAGAKLHLETTERRTGTPEIALRPERKRAPRSEARKCSWGGSTPGVRPEQREDAFIRKGRGNVRVYAGKLEEGISALDVASIIKKQYEQRARRHAGLE